MDDPKTGCAITRLAPVGLSIRFPSPEISLLPKNDDISMPDEYVRVFQETGSGIDVVGVLSIYCPC